MWLYATISKCECGGVVDGFDGVSVIEFDDENKTPNHYPYGS